MKSIYITAAHNINAPLPELVEEIRIIENHFHVLSERGVIRLESNRVASLDDIFYVFSHFGTEVEVFHYAGHANQTELQVEGGGNTKGIAGLLGLQKTTKTTQNPLKFVFLNGCASYGHVTNLHQAGVSVVLATRKPIVDISAREFSSRFYQTWVIEGKSLMKSFETAVAYLNSQTSAIHQQIEIRSIGFRDASPDSEFAWGFYLNPDLSEEQKQIILEWQINPPPQLPPMLLEDVSTKARESLQKLVYKFKQSSPDIQTEIRQGIDPLMILITRLPWTIGTHLRRLFALEESRSMTHPGIERLKELTNAYSELTRFISYIALSVLWDEYQPTTTNERDKNAPWVMPDPAGSNQRDYIYCLRQYQSFFNKDIPDTIHLKKHIDLFLQSVETQLGEAYLFMEELKRALFSTDGPERLQDLIQIRTGKAEGLEEICLQTETIFARFLEISLFLTEYKLYSVRGIQVDKIRFLEMEYPYVHKTMTIHGAFCETKVHSTLRKHASDNYCILLAPRKVPTDDPLFEALNLSPFYIDKSAFIEDKTNNYPTIYVLKRHSGGDGFVYEYIDGDINHQYVFGEDHQFEINEYGAKFPSALEIRASDSERFEKVHLQLMKLYKDFQII